ncbi:uncharacterized protein EDB91DRAFT_488481 [Suillus paluster]|uniref:uncharacterized protein n=1 Tax=Suillus paluster TaxID=48578 RepID=UPI001B8745FA|nr:uncharacterized protein EDB91DRAFT_488481 [Suillus paluster]KAG1737077.1 hypothetical protein EDB91DRAFT_488481 [Suillus paluster]
MIRPSDGFAAPLPTAMWETNTAYNHRNLIQGQYSTQLVSAFIPQALGIPQTQSIYSYPTATNMLTSVSNNDSWNSPQTLHNSQDNGRLLRGTGHSSCSAGGSDYSSSYTFPMRYPNAHPLCSFSQDIHFVFDTEISTPANFPPYSELSQHCPNSAISQPGPPSEPLPPMIPLPATPESLQTRFASQPHASHGGPTCSNQPPTRQPDSDQPSSPLLISCRWQRDVGTCGFTGTLQMLRAHCQTRHFIGPQNAQIACRWETCNYHKRSDPTVRVMRRDCMWRHTCEVHLGMKRST